MEINTRKLLKQLLAAGIPVEGVSATEPPRIDFRHEATPAQREQAQLLLQAHVPEDNADRREQAYQEQGITGDIMILALWEQIVEGKPEKVQALQKIRQEIEKQFPLDAT